uniref:NAD(P)(+)--arginine ADP-ribosyltransferase n=1 Tax=Hucho hucho TaxID=62062 RepID=A0A4W5NMK6_9TELE
MARHKILTFTLMYFIQAWTLGVDSKMVNLHQPDLITLDMVPDSVDDMYNGCTENMYNKVEKEYLPNENNTGGIFQKAWKGAQACADNVTQRFTKDNSEYNSEDKLTNDHIKAICAYSGSQTKIYEVFNQAVRTNRTEYTTSFQFHSLHFLLTDALRLLKENQHGCHTTYRRTRMLFNSTVNQTMRFGFFASSSFLTNLTHFGEISCFNITTCSGAYLKSYPVLGKKEKEVLIPPFEMFKIIKKEKGKHVNDCQHLYELESVGLQSNLNCKAVEENTLFKLSVSQ